MGLSLEMKQLIVNADDFGLHTEINKGIIKGYQEGFITSTSLMCSAPCFREAVALAKACPNLGIGIHLTLVGGVASVLPKEKVSSLLDEKRKFLPNYVAFAKRYYSGGVKPSELEAELRAQIEAALATGLNVTHLDSHQHTHVLPGIIPLVQRLGQEYGIYRLRIPKESYGFSGGFSAGLGRRLGRAGLTYCANLAEQAAKAKGFRCPDHFYGMLAGGNLNVELVGNILAQLPEGTSEIMTHPGLSTASLGKLFAWNYHWEQELEAYLAPANKKLLEEKQIRLINFGDL